MDEIEKLQRAFYRHNYELDGKLLDKIWGKLCSEGAVQMALHDDAMSALEVLLIDARPIVDGARMQQDIYESPDFDDGLPGTQAERKEPEEKLLRLDDHWQERTRVFEEHVARIATDDPLVRNYRDRVLGGKLLTPERAQKFVNSPASRYLSLERFERLGIPVVDHVAELVEEESIHHPGHGTWHRASIRVEPPGIELSEMRVRRFVPLQLVSHLKSPGAIFVADLSVLGELAELADKLAEAYPWPLRTQITNFVLTGAAPEIATAKIVYSWKATPYASGPPFGGFEYITIGLEVAPSVSPEVVEAIYREARREISGKHKYRRIEEKGLQMIRFIAAYDEPPTGRRLLEAWNNTEWVKKNPKWSYDEGKPGASSRFWKHYHTARRALAYTKRSETGDS